MANLSPEEIKQIVREVVNELRHDAAISAKTKKEKNSGVETRALIVFQSGIFRLDEALKQVGMIESQVKKSGVFTSESARAWICGEDLREKTGARCILDTVKQDGLMKVLEKADILVLPTLCMKVAAKVASLTCDDPESGIVFSALARGKKVLAARDGFMFWEFLANGRLREEIESILEKLEQFGIVFCKTEELSGVFNKITSSASNPSAPQKIKTRVFEKTNALSLVTAKDISLAFERKEGEILLASGGKVTPLARDMAKEYAITILEQAGQG